MHDRLEAIHSNLTPEMLGSNIGSIGEYTITSTSSRGLYLHYKYGEPGQQTTKLQSFVKRAVFVPKLNPNSMNVIISLRTSHDGSEITIYWFGNSNTPIQSAQIKQKSFKIKEYYQELFAVMIPPPTSAQTPCDIKLLYLLKGETSTYSFYTYLKESSAIDYGTFKGDDFDSFEDNSINSIFYNSALYIDYDSPKYYSAGNQDFLRKFKEASSPYPLYATRIFDHSSTNYLALTPSRILLVSNLYDPASNNFDIEQLGLILPNFDYLTVSVSSDQKYLAFLAKRNAFNSFSDPEYKIVVYKKGNQFAHHVLDVALEDTASITGAYAGLFTITDTNKLVFSSALKNKSGASIFQINDHATISARSPVLANQNNYIDMVFYSMDYNRRVSTRITNFTDPGEVRNLVA